MGGPTCSQRHRLFTILKHTAVGRRPQFFQLQEKGSGIFGVKSSEVSRRSRKKKKKQARICNLFCLAYPGANACVFSNKGSATIDLNAEPCFHQYPFPGGHVHNTSWQPLKSKVSKLYTAVLRMFQIKREHQPRNRENGWTTCHRTSSMRTSVGVSTRRAAGKGSICCIPLDAK